MSVWKRYFKVADPATPDEVESGVWNDARKIKALYREHEKYQEALLEQYKLYVEMADRISARRGIANTFFVTLHGGILAVIGTFLTKQDRSASLWLLAPLLMLALGLCLAWFWAVRSYRQLNSGKFAVIGAIERRLPASLWWDGEWTALRGEQKDPATYWALTHLEMWVPVLFATAYVLSASLEVVIALAN